MKTVLYRVEPAEGTIELGFECPGCGCAHSFRIEGPGPVWRFDGNMERPTFAPSLLVRGWINESENDRCHSFVRDGQIQFLSDCTHALAGQTVPLTPID